MSLEKERRFPIPVGIPHVTVAFVDYYMNKGEAKLCSLGQPAVRFLPIMKMLL